MNNAVACSHAHPEVESILSLATEHELTSDFSSLVNILYPLWQNIRIDPDVATYSALLQARIYRQSGYLLVFYGQRQCSSEMVGRGIKLLGEAISLFELTKEIDAMYEAKIVRAAAYGGSGDFDKCEKNLDLCEEFYRKMPVHHNYFLTRINQLFVWQKMGHYNRARATIESHLTSVQKSACSKIRVQFFNEAGNIYRCLGLYRAASCFFEEAICAAREINSPRFLAITQNNLAILYKDEGQFVKAIQIIEEALQAVQKLDEYDLLRQLLDTKAQINFLRGDYLNALRIIKRANFYFRASDDYPGRIAAHWVEAKILYALERVAEAEIAYQSLLKLAEENCAPQIVNHYQQEYDSLINISIGAERQPDIYRLVDERLSKPGATFFLLPPLLANRIFGVTEYLIVTTARAPLTTGEKTIFLTGGRYLSGEIYQEESNWHIREMLTAETFPVRDVYRIRKIEDVQLAGTFYKDISSG